jgi:hypothetical protein
MYIPFFSWCHDRLFIGWKRSGEKNRYSVGQWETSWYKFVSCTLCHGSLDDDKHSSDSCRSKLSYHLGYSI